MRNYLLSKVADALSAVSDPHRRADSTWITIITTWLFVVFCVYAVIALLLLGWMLSG